MVDPGGRAASEASGKSRPPSPPRRPWIARHARPLLAAYAVLLAVILLAPTSRVQAALVLDLVRALRFVGLDESWVTFWRAEVFMNVVIIAPLGLLGSLVFTRLRWQDWTAYAFIGATGVEILQGLVLPDRQASFSDIVANTAGAVLGALLARRLLPAPRAEK